MAETSTKPYMLRALYEWCCDNGYTPYLAVAVDGRTRVPRQHVKGGQIVLNISPVATSRLVIGNDAVTFQARFSGVAQELSIPVDNVSAIYARETGQGMAFEAVVDNDAGEALGGHGTGDATDDRPGDAGETTGVRAGTVDSIGNADLGQAAPRAARPPRGGRPRLAEVPRATPEADEPKTDAPAADDASGVARRGATGGAAAGEQAGDGEPPATDGGSAEVLAFKPSAGRRRGRGSRGGRGEGNRTEAGSDGPAAADGPDATVPIDAPAVPAPGDAPSGSSAADTGAVDPTPVGHPSTGDLFAGAPTGVEPPPDGSGGGKSHLTRVK